MDKMLIYKMGFNEDLKTAYPKYNKAALGATIDEHVLMRIKGMQDLGKLNQVDITMMKKKDILKKLRK